MTPIPDVAVKSSLINFKTTFFLRMWAAVSAAYSALLSSSYFERINDDDDDVNTRRRRHIQMLSAQLCRLLRKINNR